MLVTAEVGERRGVLHVPRVADPLEEQHREHVRLEVGRVNRPAEAVRGRPEARFEFLLRQLGHVRSSGSGNGIGSLLADASRPAKRLTPQRSCSCSSTRRARRPYGSSTDPATPVRSVATQCHDLRVTFQHYHPAAHIGLFSLDTHACLRRVVRVYTRDRIARSTCQSRPRASPARRASIVASTSMTSGSRSREVYPRRSTTCARLRLPNSMLGFVSLHLSLTSLSEARTSSAGWWRGTRNDPKPTDADLHAISHSRTRERHLQYPMRLFAVNGSFRKRRLVIGTSRATVATRSVKWADGRHGYVIPLTPTPAYERSAEPMLTRLHSCTTGRNWVVERIWQPAQPASTGEMERINTAMWQFAFNQIYGAEHADVASLDQSARDLPEGTGDAFADAANLLLAYPAERLDHVGAFDFVAGLLDRGRPRPTTIFLRDTSRSSTHARRVRSARHGNPYHAHTERRQVKLSGERSRPSHRSFDKRVVRSLQRGSQLPLQCVARRMELPQREDAVHHRREELRRFVGAGNERHFFAVASRKVH